jgi:hypothetical protein
MHRNQVTCSLQNMQDSIEENMTSRGRNSGMTNMLYHHTCPISGMNVI